MERTINMHKEALYIVTISLLFVKELETLGT